MPEPSEINPQLQAVIGRLLHLTQRGALTWESSTRRSAEPFMVNLTESTIRLRSRDDDERPPYQIQILNSNGIMIETIEADTQEEFDTLDKLYQLARRQALNVDEVIGSVLRDLNIEGKGKEDQ